MISVQRLLQRRPGPVHVYSAIDRLTCHSIFRWVSLPYDNFYDHKNQRPQNFNSNNNLEMKIANCLNGRMVQDMYNKLCKIMLGAIFCIEVSSEQTLSSWGMGEHPVCSDKPLKCDQLRMQIFSQIRVRKWPNMTGITCNADMEKQQTLNSAVPPHMPWRMYNLKPAASGSCSAHSWGWVTGEINNVHSKGNQSTRMTPYYLFYHSNTHSSATR